MAWMVRILSCVVIIIVCLVISALLRGFQDIYQQYEVSKIYPIKGYVQIAYIVTAVFASVMLLAVLGGKDPWLLVSGFGALSAVIMVVFRDSLLGLVAGIQIAAIDMVRIGVWIEVSSVAAGFVIDISLITVKVQRVDKTVVSIPSYSLVSGVFWNRREVMRSGYRLLRRRLYIDAQSVHPCTADLLSRLPPLLPPDTTQAEEKGVLTNLALFRQYALDYLRKHPALNSSMRLTIRIAEANSIRGIPLEVYAFTDKQEFHQFADLRFELFDHLGAMLSAFDLRLFQAPAGTDIRGMGQTQLSAC
jgi:miniconductance mechanosensitive channel